MEEGSRDNIKNNDELVPEKELASRTLAELYLSQGEVEKAFRVYDELSQREPEELEWRMRKEEIYRVLRLKEIDIKIQKLRKYLEIVQKERTK